MPTLLLFWAPTLIVFFNKRTRYVRAYFGVFGPLVRRSYLVRSFFPKHVSLKIRRKAYRRGTSVILDRRRLGTPGT